ncbi:MAG: nucleotide-binding protein [Candidatus Riflebacteria bacterium]|nr:nucleotide-binding protein [Candidatus Riflebacteria bacterium]
MHRISIVVIALVTAAGTVCPPALAIPPSPAPGAASPGDTAPPIFLPTIKGKVLEKIDASAYSYLRLSTDAGEVWAAVPQLVIAVGTQVEIANAQRMDGFESKTLKRTFDRIVFGTVAGLQDREAAAAGPGPAGSSSSLQTPACAASPGHGAPAGGTDKAGSTSCRESPAALAAPGDAMPPPGMAPRSGSSSSRSAGAGSASVDLDAIKVARSGQPDGKTVAEAWAQKAALKGTKVSIRGKVVKFHEGILDRNWLHLRDGTGSETAGDHDLTVTTRDVAAVGDVVEINGTLNLDRDFGAGYAYAVIVEGATVKKEPATPGK